MDHLTAYLNSLRLDLDPQDMERLTRGTGPVPLYPENCRSMTLSAQFRGKRHNN